MTLIKMAVQALLEDAFENDVTTQSLKDFAAAHGKGFPATVSYHVVAKAPGVFAGTEWAKAVALAAGVELTRMHTEGASFEPSQKLIEGVGETGRVLALERTLLNGLQYVCGIATRTRAFVRRLESDWREAGCQGPVAGLYHTRKTIPLSRPLALIGIEAGGGRRHRVSLSDRILFKENHKYFLGGKLGEYVSFLAKRGEKNFLIEVENLFEAQTAVEAGARHLMLDNFSPENVRQAMKALPPGLDIEISGGLTLESLKDYCVDGVTRFSVGSLTRDIESVDLSLDWTAL